MLFPALCLAAWVPPDQSAWKPADSFLPKPSPIVSTYFTQGEQITTDWQTGWVFANPYGKGIWRSKDTCKTWQQVWKQVADSLAASNSSGAVFIPSFYSTQEGYIGYFPDSWPTPVIGDPGYSLDRGETWHSFTSIMRNWNFGVLDIASKGKLALGQIHEESGGVYKTVDGGVHWTKLHDNSGNPGSTSLGIFSPKIFIESNEAQQLIRSEDSGKTWNPIVSAPSGPAYGPLQFFNNKPYWLVATGVYTTADSGKQWTRVGSQFPEKCWAGPFFGKDEGRMVCVTASKFIESSDTGKTWYTLAPLPAGFNTAFKFFCFSYDHVYDILYADCMICGATSGAYKLPLCRWPAQPVTPVISKNSGPMIEKMPVSISMRSENITLSNRTSREVPVYFYAARGNLIKKVDVSGGGAILIDMMHDFAPGLYVLQFRLNTGVYRESVVMSR